MPTHGHSKAALESDKEFVVKRGGGGGGGGGASFFRRLFKPSRQRHGQDSLNNSVPIEGAAAAAAAAAAAEDDSTSQPSSVSPADADAIVNANADVANGEISAEATPTEALTSDEDEEAAPQDGEEGDSDGVDTADEANKDPTKYLDEMWSVNSTSYDFKSVLKTYTEIEKYVKPRFMKFIIDNRERQIVDRFGKVMRTVKPGAVHPLIDKVVQEFCTSMGLTETKRLPRVEERIFLWFNRHRAMKMLPSIAAQRQIYFLNYISWDSMFTDLQCLVSRLRLCSLKLNQIFPDHTCSDEEKIDEIINITGQSTEYGKPKMVFIEKQTICQHIYSSQEFNKPCEVEECHNFNRRMCKCFQLNIFMQETLLLSTKIMFQNVLNKFRSGEYSGQRWLIRASSMKGGNGVQFIDTADELESFLRYDESRTLRGQFFVLQRYPRNPMLLHNRRFDCRMYLLVCTLTDRRVLGFLHPGFVRVAQKDYDADSNDLRCHLTSPMTWDPDYSRYKSKTIPVNDYCIPYFGVHQLLGLPPLELVSIDSQLLNGDDNFLMKLHNIVQQLVKHMSSMVQDQPGTWQVFGLDILIDGERNPWLTEVMTYPCVGEPDTNSFTQNSLLPGVFAESLAIVFELNQRDFYTRQKKEWMNLSDMAKNRPGLITAQRNFLWLYSTEPDKLISYNTTRTTADMHWYKKWRVTEDFNDYILYLKNFRSERFTWTEDTAGMFYGRKIFDRSPAFKAKRLLPASAWGTCEGDEEESANKSADTDQQQQQQEQQQEQQQQQQQQQATSENN